MIRKDDRLIQIAASRWGGRRHKLSTRMLSTIQIIKIEEKKKNIRTRTSTTLRRNK